MPLVQGSPGPAPSRRRGGAGYKSGIGGGGSRVGLSSVVGGRMALELFLDPLSQPCRALFIFAKKHQIPFQYRLVELIKGQHWQEAYGKVNPMRQVPVLKEGDFILTESVAILLYLARKFKTPDHWYPSDLQKRARVDEYLSWQHTAMRMHGCKVFLIQVYLPLFLGHPMPPEKLEEALKDLERVLDLFEEKFLQDRPFIVGNEISLADLMAIVELMEVVCGGHDVFKGRPKMAAWRSRVEDAIGKDLFLEAHKEMFSLEGLTTKHLSPQLKEQLMQTYLKEVK